MQCGERASSDVLLSVKLPESPLTIDGKPVVWPVMPSQSKVVGGSQGLYQLMEPTVVVRCRKADSTLVGGLIKVCPF
jgi:hypothetical protein